MARLIAIWITGTGACACFGGLAGYSIDGSTYGSGPTFFGVIGGGLAFVCFRLWMGERR